MGFSVDVYVYVSNSTKSKSPFEQQGEGKPRLGQEPDLRAEGDAWLRLQEVGLALLR